jgi:hypothetical protein
MPVLADQPFDFGSQLVAYCIVRAARERMLPPEALLAIAMVENGRPGMRLLNKNGSYDLGVMGINTVWLNERSPLKYYVSAQQLADDVCANIHTAAWILAGHNRVTGEIWPAIGRYHSPGNPSYAQRYILNVNTKLVAARRLIAGSYVYQYYIKMFFGPESSDSLSQPMTPPQ